jgi:hypothetical protein
VRLSPATTIRIPSSVYGFVAPAEAFAIEEDYLKTLAIAGVVGTGYWLQAFGIYGVFIWNGLLGLARILGLRFSVRGFVFTMV